MPLLSLMLHICPPFHSKIWPFEGWIKIPDPTLKMSSLSSWRIRPSDLSKGEEQRGALAGKTVIF
jgi:hypothetical protein